MRFFALNASAGTGSNSALQRGQIYENIKKIIILNLIDVSLIDAIKTVSANFMSLDTSDHRELVEIPANRADQFSVF